MKNLLIFLVTCAFTGVSTSPSWFQDCVSQEGEASDFARIPNASNSDYETTSSNSYGGDIFSSYVQRWNPQGQGQGYDTGSSTSYQEHDAAPSVQPNNPFEGYGHYYNPEPPVHQPVNYPEYVEDDEDQRVERVMEALTKVKLENSKGDDEKAPKVVVVAFRGGSWLAGREILLTATYKGIIDEKGLEFPRGTPKMGEDSMVTAARELWEETGHRGMISKKYFEYQNLLVHFARVSGNHKTPRQSAERSARHIGWYKPDGAEVLMGRESMQMILQMAEEMKFEIEGGFEAVKFEELVEEHPTDVIKWKTWPNECDKRTCRKSKK